MLLPFSKIMLLQNRIPGYDSPKNHSPYHTSFQTVQGGENPEIISKGYLSLSLAYIRNEADILKFVDALISNTKGEGKEGDPFWTKSETLLYCCLLYTSPMTPALLRRDRYNVNGLMLENHATKKGLTSGFLDVEYPDKEGWRARSPGPAS